MSVQITVRLPEPVASYLDDQVSAGAASRASVVVAALEAHRRRTLAEKDAEILARLGDYPDFDALTAYADPDLP